MSEQEVVERVARAICDDRGWDIDDGYWGPLCRKDAQAALAALRPGDLLPNDLILRSPEGEEEMADHLYRQAAEATREACLKAKGDWAFADLAREISDDYAAGLRRGLEDWDKAIRALDIAKIAEGGE